MQKLEGDGRLCTCLVGYHFLKKYLPGENPNGRYWAVLIWFYNDCRLRYRIYWGIEKHHLVVKGPFYAR